MEVNNLGLIEKAAQIMQDEGMLTIRMFWLNGCWAVRVNGEFVIDANSRSEMLGFISAAALKASNGVKK